MNRTCAVVGCANRTRSSYGRYCGSHVMRDRRHGHPRQPTITRAYLKPIIRRIQQWMDKHPKRDEVWSKLEDALQRIASAAQGELLARERGAVTYVPAMTAASDVAAVMEQGDQQKAILTVLALVILWDEEPGAFKSDRAFRFQMARLWRGLTDLHVASYWKHDEGTVKRVYRDPAPRSAEVLGQMLIDGLGPYAMQISSQWKQALADEHRAKQEGFDAIAARA